MSPKGTLRLFCSMMLLGCLFFADNLELHFLSHFLVEADCGGVNTDLLNRVLDLVNIGF